MIYHIFAAAADETANISNANTIWIIIFSNIISGGVATLFTYLLSHKKDRANIANVNAETTKTNNDALLETVGKVVELMDKFKVAQDNYLGLKDQFAVLSRELDDFKETVGELITLIESALNGDPAHTAIKAQIDKIRREYFNDN